MTSVLNNFAIYTQFELKQYCELKSKYSKQIYTLLMDNSYKNERVNQLEIDKDKLFRYLELKDSYNNEKNVQLKILTPIKKDFKELFSKKLTMSNLITHIIISESIIDSLSLFELEKFSSNTTLLCSTNGQITPHHCELVNFLANKACVVLGFDNDEKGLSFTQKMIESLKDKDYLIKTPCLKDFNDDLITCKFLGFNEAFTMNELDERDRR